MITLIQNIKLNKSEILIFPFHLAPLEVSNLVPENMQYAHKVYFPLSIEIDKNREVLKKISDQEKTTYIEMSKNLIPLQDFFDHYHLKESGEEIKADFVASKYSLLLTSNK